MHRFFPQETKLMAVVQVLRKEQQTTQKVRLGAEDLDVLIVIAVIQFDHEFLTLNIP